MQEGNEKSMADLIKKIRHVLDEYDLKNYMGTLPLNEVPLWDDMVEEEKRIVKEFRGKGGKITDYEAPQRHWN